MNKTAFIFLSFFCFLSLPAFGKPSVEIVMPNPKVTFTKRPTTDCDDNPILNGSVAAGCTRPHFVWEVSVDCASEKITLTVGFSKMEVQIREKYYQMGTLSFDQMIKHELTHVSLYRNVAKKYAQSTAAACLLRFEKLKKQGKGCGQIQREISALFFDYMDRMIEEAHRQNSLIDGGENYAYQHRQVAELERKQEEEKAELRRKQEEEKAELERKQEEEKKKAVTPDVRVTMLETKRRHNISAPDVRPAPDGRGMVRNLMTEAFLDLDRASADVDCKTRTIQVKLGYTAVIAFNENEGTSLYAYLSDSLNDRIKILEERSRKVPEKIKQDIAKIYKSYAENGVSCEDIRPKLKKRMTEYRQKISKEMIRQNNILGDAVPLWRLYFEQDRQAYFAARQSSDTPRETKTVARQISSGGPEPVSEIPREKKDMKTPEAEKAKTSSEPQNKTEAAENKVVPADQKPVMGAWDRYYISRIKFFFTRVAEELELKERFDNILKSIKNKYNQLISGNDGSMTKDTKAVENSK